MHPPLALYKHPLCRDEILSLQECHKTNPLNKFFGVCNDYKTKLDACFRKEKDFKRRVNMAKAKATKERLDEIRESLGSSSQPAPDRL